MPNYNENEMTVVGKKGLIKEFITKYFTGDCIDFEKILPSPKTKEECPEYFICDPEEVHITPAEGREWFNWYKFNNSVWGTKWNAWNDSGLEVDIDKAFPEESDDDEIEWTFFFTTAWCPPMGIYTKLCELYHNKQDGLWISFFYIEEGMGFCGNYDYVNGDIYYEGGSDNPEFRQCTIDNGYYDQEYWDDWDAEYGDEEDE